MRTTRNPGVLAVSIGVGLAVLFALCSVVGIFDARTGFGLAAVSLVAAALIYIFYVRSGAIEKSGYAALLFVIAIAFIVPALLISQQQTQAKATTAQYDETLHRGAALFGQYCASCHGYQGQGLSGPKLNNNPAVNKLSSDQIYSIITGGIPDNTNPSTYLMPAWGAPVGPLTEDDINYLVALIQSSNKDYLKTQGLASTNGFTYVRETLTATQQKEYDKQQKSGSKPDASSFADLTSQKTVTIDAVDVPANGANWSWEAVGAKSSAGNATPNITVKAGTTILFGNKSNQIHNVFQGPSGTPDNKFPPSPGVLAANSGDTYKVTLTAPGDYPYYCGLHPAMIGYITVVP
ncbi:MAG TPA: c-type cytochrome [Ktedonobacterales bacterium]